MWRRFARGGHPYAAPLRNATKVESAASAVASLCLPAYATAGNMLLSLFIYAATNADMLRCYAIRYASSAVYADISH